MSTTWSLTQKERHGERGGGGGGRLGVTEKAGVWPLINRLHPWAPAKPGRSHDCGGEPSQSLTTAGLLCSTAAETQLQHLHTADTFSVVPLCPQLWFFLMPKCSSKTQPVRHLSSCHHFFSAKIQRLKKKGGPSRWCSHLLRWDSSSSSSLLQVCCLQCSHLTAGPGPLDARCLLR